MALKIIIKNLLVSLALVEIMINYKILSDKEKCSRYANVKNRCGARYQSKNQKYIGTFMCDEWLEDKNKFYTWLDENFYVIEGEKQMDIDKDIICYGNKQYRPDMCIIAPHSVNSFYESLEVGKTNIKRNAKTGKYIVRVRDMGKPIRVDDIATYNMALDIYCAIKQGILYSKAKSLKETIPVKLYRAMMDTDIKAINRKYYQSKNGEV